MNATKQQLRIQYNRAVKFGWLPFFVEASAKYDIPVFILLAIASRETNLEPKWLTKPGDNGNGFGLMQADRRSFPNFTKGDGWKDARTGIMFGAKVFSDKRNAIKTKTSGTIVAITKAGKRYETAAKAVPSWQLNYVALAAYNSGSWAHYHFSKNGNCDRGTTGKDYASDTAERAEVLKSFLGKEEIKSDPKANEVITPVPVQEEIIDEEPVSTLEENQNNQLSEPVEVQQVQPEKTEQKEPGGIRASIAGAVTFITTSGAGLISWIGGARTELIYGFFGAAAIIGIVFVWKRFDFANREKQREFELIKRREEQAHELQVLTLQAAASKDQNAVRIVPQPMKNSEVPV